MADDKKKNDQAPSQADLDEKARLTTEAAKAAEAKQAEEDALLKQMEAEEAAKLSATEAAKAAEAVTMNQQEFLAKLLATQDELLRRQVELEAQIAALKEKETGERPVVRLRGNCNPEAEAIHQAATWPKDADRKPGPVVTRTYAVTPVGAAIEQGLGPAIIDNCYDSSDAKAAYMRQYKPELHHLPVQIHEVLAQGN